jgi:hypothetical protein
MASKVASGAGRITAAGLFLLLALVLPGPVRAASVPAELFGEWAGKASEAEPPLGEFGDPVQLTLQADGSGFTLSAAAGSAVLAKVTMAPTARPDVYGPFSGGGMLSMFSSDDPPDPLAGERLLWARLGGQELVAYSFGIADDGGFVLDRYALAREGEELSVRLTRRRGVADEHVLTARLAKVR